MPYVEWSSDYALGMPEIDNQHAALFELVNYLHEIAQTGAPVFDMARAVKDMFDYADDHFAAEEAFMSAFAQTELASHKEEHDRLRVLAADYLKRFPDDPRGVCLEVTRTLKAWIATHILEVDRRLARYAQAA